MEHGQIFGGSSPTDWYLGQVPFQLRRDSATVLGAYSLGPNFVAGPGSGGAYKDFASSYTFDISVDQTIDTSGGAAGLASAGTLYGVYYCGREGDEPGTENTIRLSGTLPTSYFGQYVLENSTTFGQTCPFLGLVYLDTGPVLRDDNEFRGVASYYFRKTKGVLLRPGYVDNNAQTNLAALNNAAYARINGGTGDTGTYLTFGEDDAHFAATWCVNAAVTAALFVGIGDNSDTQPAGGAVLGVGAVAKSCVAAFATVNPGAMAVRTVTMLANTSSTAVTFVADAGRGGAAADVPSTYLSGTIRA